MKANPVGRPFIKAKMPSRALAFRLPEDEYEEFAKLAGENPSEVLRRITRAWMHSKKALKRKYGGKSA